MLSALFLLRIYLIYFMPTLFRLYCDKPFQSVTITIDVDHLNGLSSCNILGGHVLNVLGGDAFSRYNSLDEDVVSSLGRQVLSRYILGGNVLNIHWQKAH